MIINNRQVNIWRGSGVPPTIYHIWLYNDTQLKIYNGEEWITILNDTTIVEKINELLDKVSELESEINVLNTKKVNNKLISSNPVLNAGDIVITDSGTFITQNDTSEESLLKLDQLLSTQIIN